ncbi:MAG: hypothetical protein J6K23_06645 [Bacilli bacterium]|nr:hypothetical protein [Bacilli bacterium]MBP3445595.1 hypothetical protein [Bacilli bacterium]
MKNVRKILFKISAGGIVDSTKNYYSKQTEEFNFKSRYITDTGISAEKDIYVSLQNINKPEIVIPSGWQEKKL